MPKSTAAGPGGEDPGSDRVASAGHRLIHHEPICPECGSFNIAVGDVETAGGLTETALLCLECGEAWPLACVADWGGRP